MSSPVISFCFSFLLLTISL